MDFPGNNIKLKKRQHYFSLYCQNKIPKIFILIFEILSPGKLDDQRTIIMNINSMLQKAVWSILGVSSITSLTKKNCKVENTIKKIIHDVVRVDSGDIANMFNDYFVDI